MKKNTVLWVLVIINLIGLLALAYYTKRIGAIASRADSRAGSLWADVIPGGLSK